MATVDKSWRNSCVICGRNVILRTLLEHGSNSIAVVDLGAIQTKVAHKNI